MKSNKILFPLLLVLSVSALAGCGGSSLVSDDNHIYIDDNNVATTGYEDVHVEGKYYQGVHDFTYKSTGKALVKAGKTSYKIVIPSKTSSDISVARDELIHFFKIATGIELECITDENLTHSKNNKYISLGKTKLLESSGIKIDYNALTPDGCRIVTKGDSIFIVGGTDIGTLNATYDFLHIYFKYEQYSPDVYEIDRNVKNLVLYNFDVTDIPDIQQRARNYGFLLNGSGNYDQSRYGYRMRMTKGRGYYFMPVFSDFDYSSESKLSTNTNTYVPYEQYASLHPDWFSDLCTTNTYQLCYTAHGNPEELEGLIDIVTRKIIFSLKRFTPEEYPDLNVITFTIEDNFNLCNCYHCKLDEETYGASSASLIKFVNEVGRRVKAWSLLEENAEYYRPNFQIIYFAYNGYVDAPIKYNESKKVYEPSHPSMVLEDNTGVYLAIIDRGDFQFDFFNNPISNGGYLGNMGIKETLDSWGALTNSIYLWLYQTNFALYPYFYDSFSFYNQPFYNYISSKGLKMFFAQGQDTKASGNTGTNFNNLKAYLNCKLSWDSTLDQSVLMKRYFKAMYGRASEKMWDYFGLLRSFYSQMLESNPSLVNNRSIYNKINSRNNLPLASLKSLVKAVDAAQEMIKREYYSEEEYLTYKYNIEAEALFPLYAMLELYASVDLTIDERKAIAQRLLDSIYYLRNDGMNTREHGGDTIASIPLENL